jgi:phytoene dehydrogenase-like protein
VRGASGHILLDTEIKQIRVERGRAVGIETMDGNVIRARKFVASSLNPGQTFLELLDPKVVPSEWQVRAHDYKFNLVAPLLTLHLNLTEPPKYAAAKKVPSADDCYGVIMGFAASSARGRRRIADRHHLLLVVRGEPLAP